MSQNVLQQNITSVLGIDTLPLEEQTAFLSEVGDTIFQTSLLRLVSGLSEDQQQSIEQYLDSEPEPEILLQHLLEHYKEFQTILEEVTIEFKEDALTVLKEQKDDMKVIDVTDK